MRSGGLNGFCSVTQKHIKYMSVTASFMYALYMHCAMGSQNAAAGNNNAYVDINTLTKMEKHELSTAVA